MMLMWKPKNRGAQALEEWLRAEPGRTQERLAAEMGTVQQSISRWLTGSIPENPAHLAKLLDICGIALVWWVEPPKSSRALTGTE